MKAVKKVDNLLFQFEPMKNEIARNNKEGRKNDNAQKKFAFFAGLAVILSIVFELYVTGIKCEFG